MIERKIKPCLNKNSQNINTMKIISVVGARPNFMKIAPFIRAIKEYNSYNINSVVSSEANIAKPEGDNSPIQSLKEEPFGQNNKGLPANSSDMSGSAEGNINISARKKENTSFKIQNQQQITHLLVHTGQHYDDRMSRAFFQSLGIPEADINLGIGSGSHAEQVGKTMIEFEKVIIEEKPDWIVVVGDVNATLACSVTAKKLHVKVCHIEAGLRSRDESMPEEINRMVTDRLSDLLLTPDKLSIDNLKAEGVPDSRINFVGNIMIDTLEANRKKASGLQITDIIKSNILDGQKLPDSVLLNFSQNFQNNAHSGVDNIIPVAKEKMNRDIRESFRKTENTKNSTKDYAVITLHRPSNVDEKNTLSPIINFLITVVADDMPVIWPIHPRTQKMLQKFGLWKRAVNSKNLLLLHPIGYHEMLRLNMNARIMLTDSGGLQEECCVLGTPCLTLRWNTERPVTLREHGGASVLVGNNVERIKKEYRETLQLKRKPQRPELWDGNTAIRCVQSILNHSQFIPQY